MDERRIVTVLFCDVSGSTAIAEQLADPEDWAEIIREAFPLLIEPVERHGGHVSRLLGDAILAIFGAPLAHEDDPRRAILAGLAILDGLEPYRARVRLDYGVDFNVRIGINTGLVVVGEFGAGQASEYTAMGDAINVAARMQQAAEPGTVLVAGDTFRLTTPFFVFEPRGAIDVKGKAEPVDAYRAIAAAEMPGYLRGISGLAAPMVGRQHELGVLTEALDGLASQQSKIVALVGEAGLGKTRLLAEARRTWFGEGTDVGHSPESWIEDRLASFEAAQPYSLFRERLRSGFGIELSSNRVDLASTTPDLLSHFPHNERERAGLVIRALFSPDGDPAARPIDGDALRREVVETTARLWQAWTSLHGPSIYVIDDLHWVDPASSELIGPLLDQLMDLPILVLMSFRPEPASPASQLSQRLRERFPTRFVDLTLAPLDSDQSRALVTAMLSDASIPSALQEVILDKAEGNPLYVEELIRSLVDREIIVVEGDGVRLNPGSLPEQLALPGSLRGLLQARIDRLNPDARRTLQRAAVIGRTFSVPLLLEISPRLDEVERDLAELQQAGLIEPSHGDYSFHHAMIWDATLGGLVRRQRQQLHRQAGEAIERLYGDRLDEHFGLLGYHFYSARDARAVSYAQNAGEQALKVHAPAEALEHYSRAIDIAESLDIVESIADLYRQRGHASERLGDFVHARQDLERALVLAQEAGDAAREWDSLLALGRLWSERNYDRTREYYQRAHDLASEIGDQLMLARSLNWLGNWHLNVDQSSEGLAFHQQALEIFRSYDDRAGLAETLDLLGQAFTISGDALAAADSYRQAVKLFRELDDRAGLVSSLVTLSLRSATLHSDHIASHEDPLEISQRDIDEALEIAREIGWRSGESYALWVLAFLLGSRGRYGPAFEAARAGHAVATEIEHRQWTLASGCALGALYLDLLAWERALEHLEPALELAIRTGSRHWIGSATGFLVRALIGTGGYERADALLAAVPDPDPRHLTVAQRHVCCARAEYLLARDRPDEAYAVVAEAIASSPHAARQPIIRLAYLRGLARIALGEPDRAMTELEATRSVAEHQGAAGLTWRLYAAHATAAAMSGDDPTSQRARSAARNIVGALANEISEAGLRAQFLARAGHALNGPQT